MQTSDKLVLSWKLYLVILVKGSENNKVSEKRFRIRYKNIGDEQKKSNSIL